MTKDRPIQQLKKIFKRDGREVPFEMKNVVRAISKAVAETGEFEEAEAKRLAGIVVTILTKANGHHIPTVEEVQDIVEQVLMAGGHYKTAKAYILYRQKRSQVRQAESMIGVEDDLGLSLNQLKVIERRYLLHDEDGKVAETPKAWLTRVARTLAGVEKKKKYWEGKFLEVMANFEFLPAGRTLNNAGTKQNQLANCFVLPVEDSMEGIFDAVKWTALVHQTGGGTGFNFSNLRPQGDSVSKSSGGFATGPVSFMKVFDVATRQVMQGGKKRGANMGILNVDHPDIMEFITCKTEEGEIANFNISVGMTDEFMKAVEKDGDFRLKNRRTGQTVTTIKARTLMDQIVTLAWRTGDPGMIYLDAINENNPLMETQGRIEATNPCGEQPLHPFDACNLGSINLARFVRESYKEPSQSAGRQGTRNKKKAEEYIDWGRLREVTGVAVRMLDNVIDAGVYPLPQISETVKLNRRIGLGVMGWADMLFKLGVAYDSEEGVQLAERVMSFIQKESWVASRELAEEKGAFPRWGESAFAKGWNPLTKSYQKPVTRNQWKVQECGDYDDCAYRERLVWRRIPAAGLSRCLL
jgi:ribonucleoside-diphosphate reductase alpha chain